MNDILIADVDHNVNKGTFATREWPVQLTHGSMVMFGNQGSSWKLAVGMEHFQSMGFAAFGVDGSKIESPMNSILGNLTSRQQKLLAANGVHLLVSSAFTLYIMANVARREPVTTLSRMRRMSSAWDLQDGEGEEELDD